MLAKTSSCVDSLDIQNIKETAQKLRDKFCERHPEIQGKRRDQVKDIFYYAIKFNHKNMPTDSNILNDINKNMHTSSQLYEYEYLQMKKNGNVDIFWKHTEEPLININLKQFKSYEEFHGNFRGPVDEKRLRDFWEKQKKEEELNSINMEFMESSDQEYEDIVIPKIPKKKHITAKGLKKENK